MTIEQFIQQMRTLNQSGLYTSAEFMGNFILSSKAVNGTSYPEAFVTFADALVGKEEYNRAIYYYRKGLKLIQPSSERAAKKTATGIKTQSKTLESEVPSVTFKIAQCFMKLNDSKSAVAILETIPQSDRNIAMNTMLAKHYHHTGNDSAAINSYKQILRENPFAVEAVFALLELNAVSSTDIQSLNSSKSLYSEWTEQATLVQQLQTKQDYKGALTKWVAMDTEFTNNLHILHNIAKCEVQTGYSEKAKGTFERIRSVDPYYMDSMDTYASIIKAQGSAIELNKLSQQLVSINSQRAEPWTAIAMYCELKGKKQEALSSIEKALELNDRHIIAHLLKGNLLLSSDHPDEAVLSFKRAYSLNKNILAFAGLVRSYLGVAKIKEALTYATEAYKLMPGNPQALSLLGLVLSQPVDPNYRKRAKQKFEEALKIDKFCLDAVLGLSQLHVVEGRLPDAIELLKEQLQSNSKDFLHAKLAEVLVLAGKHSEALEHYNTALSLNPNSDLAKKGLERLEKIINGEDPDREEEEEEEEEYVDQEEEEEEIVE